MSIRVLLYSNDPIVSAGMKALFDAFPRFELGGVASDRDELILKAKTASIDVVLLELHPALTMTSIADIRRQLPSTPMVLWVQSIAVELGHQVIQLGVQGILRKDLPVELLLRCIEKVAAGELWYERSLSELLLRSREVTLSPRERQLLRLISQGLSNKQIATALIITEGTVKVYLSKLYKKVGVLDRFELALYGLKNLQYGAAVSPGDEASYCPSSLIVQQRAKQM